MATSMREEIKVGELAVRFLVEGEQSGGSVAVFEFDVPAGAKVAAILDSSAGGPPDLAAIAAVMRRHGLSPVGRV